MGGQYATAKITLDYPLYASDFDPKQNQFVLVGGGGGEGRSGVGNKITLLSASRTRELVEVVDIKLSREEDSVTSLAYAQSTPEWGTVYAGINSSMKEQQAGKNDHLRSFAVQYPPKKITKKNELGVPDVEIEDERFLVDDANREAELAKQRQDDEKAAYKGETKALSKVSYFTSAPNKRPETFQRILRLSKRTSHEDGSRLGAVATGLAPQGEIVLFAANHQSPSLDDIRGRIPLGKGEEAADLDLVVIDGQDTNDANFRIAYCTDHAIFAAECPLTKRSSFKVQVEEIYSAPKTAEKSPKPQFKFRSIRFLTSTLLALVENQANGKGSNLLLLDTNGKCVHTRKLHSGIKSSTALSIATFPFTRSSAKPKAQEIQSAIAIAGADNSITIFTINHASKAPYTALTLQKHLFLSNVHPTSITSLNFSHFVPPTTTWSKTPAQALKLVSTSVANTCVVHTLPIFVHNPVVTEDRVSEYLLVPMPKRLENIKNTTLGIIMAILVVALGSLIMQSWAEIRGAVPETIGAKNWLSDGLRERIAVPYLGDQISSMKSATPLGSKISEQVEAPVETFYGAMGQAGDKARDALHDAQTRLGLQELLKQRNSGSDTYDAGNDQKSIIVYHHDDQNNKGKSNIVARLSDHDDASHHRKTALRWEDLKPAERASWKKKLIEAGEWSVGEGETVLKGVFFSGLGQVVGAAAAGAVG